MITMSWQSYTLWLIDAENFTPEDALNKACALYQKQRGEDPRITHPKAVKKFCNENDIFIRPKRKETIH